MKSNVGLFLKNVSVYSTKVVEVKELKIKQYNQLIISIISYKRDFMIFIFWYFLLVS